MPRGRGKTGREGRAKRGHRCRADRSKEEFDILCRSNEPILDLLPPKSAPARTFEVMKIGRLRKASLHEISPAAPVLLC